jgi:hypothetical protein
MKTRLALSFACAAALILALGCGSGGGSDSLQVELDSLDSSITSGTAAFTYSAGDSASSITDDFDLPAATKGGYTATWTETTDAYNNVAVSGTAVSVLQSTSDRTVVLTAGVTVGGKSGTKDFSFTIKLTDKGYIQGLARSYDENASSFSPLVGTTVKAATDTGMSPVAATTATDSSGDYRLKLSPASYYVSYTLPELPFRDVLLYKTTQETTDNYTVGDTAIALPEHEYRSSAAYPVDAGAVTTVNFTIIGY